MGRRSRALESGGSHRLRIVSGRELADLHHRKRRIISQPLESVGSRFPTSWSRDDRWLAFTERNPSTTADIWLLDGQQIYYHSNSGLVAVDVAYEPHLRLGQPRLGVDDPTLRVLDIAADGRFLAIQSQPMPEVKTLDVILSFDQLLQ